MKLNQTIAIIVSIAVLAIAYQALIVVPKEKIASQERAIVEKARLERLEKLQKAEAYDSCVSEAYFNYTADWNKACETAGKEDSCTLYSSQSDRVDGIFKEAKNTCVTLYK